MKNKKKTLNVDIHFADRDGLKRAFDDLKRDYINQRYNNSKVGNGYDYKSLYTYEEEVVDLDVNIPVKEGIVKIVDGKLCNIIRSKV